MTMKSKILTIAAGATMLATASAYNGLYYVGSEAQESLPLKWVVGVDAVYDDNVTPVAFGASRDSAFSLNPYVGVSFVQMTPQSTLDLYARLGGTFYLDSPKATGAHDAYGNARLGLNWTHRFSERLRFVSRNFIAYQLEPDYTYGVATTRQIEPYIHWSTDQSVGYRWTERLATYTGVSFSGIDYQSGVRNQDRTTWGLHHQFRYQLTPQSVLTAEYRYSDTSANGSASDRRSHYILGGIEHRVSPTTILIAKAGAQVYNSRAARGASGTHPFFQAALNSRINESFMVRAFARYGIEAYDSVRWVGAGLYDFDKRRTLRIGLSGEYNISPRLSAYAGIDYIPSKFSDGRLVGAIAPTPFTARGLSEDLYNAYIGLQVKLTDTFFANATYNYTYSDSDFANYSYHRNRVSIGVRAEF